MLLAQTVRCHVTCFIHVRRSCTNPESTLLGAGWSEVPLVSIVHVVGPMTVNTAVVLVWIGLLCEHSRLCYPLLVRLCCLFGRRRSDRLVCSLEQVGAVAIQVGDIEAFFYEVIHISLRVEGPCTIDVSLPDCFLTLRTKMIYVHSCGLIRELRGQTPGASTAFVHLLRKLVLREPIQRRVEFVPWAGGGLEASNIVGIALLIQLLSTKRFRLGGAMQTFLRGLGLVPVRPTEVVVSVV
mmetsp:Transcript_20287/g.24244  ORF Transcript_20287/g.24244 Transcript_20287/m.24244 type:complete len:239 (+) Transcript_20287:769-1485(+)